MSTETYSLLIDFDNGLNARKLLDEINVHSSINKTCTTVKNLNSTNVNITFDGILDAAEKTALDQVVVDHVSVGTTNTMTSIPVVASTVLGLTGYVTVAIFSYSPTWLPNFLKMTIVSSTTGSTYDIRVRSMMDSTDIVTATFSNTTSEEKELSPIINLPDGSDTYEVQCNCNGALDTTTITACTVYHD